MTGQDGDPFGSTDSTTQYEAQGRRGARAGKARSVWAVAIAAVFLIALGTWVLLRPHGATDPAPGGSAGNGFATQRGLASDGK